MNQLGNFTRAKTQMMDFRQYAKIGKETTVYNTDITLGKNAP